MAFGLLLTGCNKQEVVSAELGRNDAGKEIVLDFSDSFALDVETKATAITAVPSSVYWGATTGSSTETAKWSATSSSTSSSKVSTGKYQTNPVTAYNWYVANQSFTVGASTTMTVANNNTDVLAGRTAQNSTSTPSVTLNHVFARTGSLTMNTQSGYTISNVSWKIVGKSSINGTAGTYNMTTGAWTAASSTLSETAITSSSDMYLIPGTYTIKCTYTLTKDDWNQTFTKSADVTIVQGKINNISGTATGGAASEIVLSLSVAAWGSQNHTLTFS